MHSFNLLKSFPLGAWGDHDLSNLFLYTILDPNFVLISTIHIYTHILFTNILSLQGMNVSTIHILFYLGRGEISSFC